MYDAFWNLYSSYYSSSELTVDQSTGAPTYSILQQYALATGLDSVSDNAFAGSTSHFAITSGYRNPAAEVAAAQQNGVKAYLNSRHLAGDAVDLSTGGDSAYWQAVYSAGLPAGACVEPVRVQGNYNHVHLDWRTQTGVSNTPSGGNSFPSSASCPPGWGP